jgi:saccharopine dehydrogenase-like NADP-dependent oxidoreductase
MKRVLLLGAGLVSRPLAAYLAQWPDVTLTVGDLDRMKAEQTLGPAQRGRAVAVSMDEDGLVVSLVAEANLVISLLPFTLHAKVARMAIAHRVPLITTSYVSAEMRALDGAARAAGVLILNEIGLDPGLDHMSAMREIRRIRAEGARLVSFRSCCGGLPAPEANTNPWGYKFSWSPRGVLAVGLNPARWLEDGRIVDVTGDALFTHVAAYDVSGVGRLEVYPNRDATAYLATYGIEGVRTMFRGTLRYPGWCETLLAVSRLGLLDGAVRSWRPGTTYGEFMEAFAEPGTAPVQERVAATAGIRADGPVAERLRWAGLFSARPLPSPRGAPIDMLCARLAECMAYEAGERDMIVLRHEFGVVDGQGRDASRVSTLVAFGEPGGDTAMARTVSLPAAVAARLILDGRVASTGVRIPVDPEIYDPVLEALQPMGILFQETRTTP